MDSCGPGVQLNGRDTPGSREQPWYRKYRPETECRSGEKVQLSLMSAGSFPPASEVLALAEAISEAISRLKMPGGFRIARQVTG